MEQQTIEYLLRRSRRRTVGFLIDDHGLRISAPRWLNIADIEEAILSKKRWIQSTLEERRNRLASPRQRTHWGDGTILPYLGGNITLRLTLGDHVPACIDSVSGDLILTVPDYTSENQVKEHVQAWMQKEAHRVFAERMPIYEAKLGVACKSLKLSSAVGRWGSCSPGGRIRLNWRLIHFSLPLIDYVIVHELAHLREMNHGPRFWAEVASAIPEYEEVKKILREQSQAVMNIV